MNIKGLAALLAAATSLTGVAFLWRNADQASRERAVEAVVPLLSRIGLARDGAVGDCYVPGRDLEPWELRDAAGLFEVVEEGRQAFRVRTVACSNDSKGGDGRPGPCRRSERSIGKKELAARFDANPPKFTRVPCPSKEDLAKDSVEKTGEKQDILFIK